MAETIRKSLAKTEIVWLTQHSADGTKLYLITSDKLRTTYTLWAKINEGYNKIATASEPTKLYNKMR